MDRRTFLQLTGAAAAVGLGARAVADGERERFGSLLSLLEDTPRERLPGELTARIRAGLGYEELLAALAVATVRNVQPYPAVGFKYHSFMVLQATDLTTRSVASSERWLPILWAADYFKQAQADERRQSGWRMSAPPPRENASREQARARLAEALDEWDREAADAAIVTYLHAAGAEEPFALLFEYGARDLRAIGHKAIAVENAHRLLGLLGPEYAEPVLRSTVAALLNTGDDPDPATHDHAADRPWRENLARVDEIPDDWIPSGGTGAPIAGDPIGDAGARGELLAALRRVSEEEAGGAVTALVRQGVAAGTIWEALFASGAEWLVRLPQIVPLHAQTTATALHYAWRHAPQARTRKLALLQCAAFMPMFRDSVGNARAGVTIDGLEPASAAAGAEGLEEAFAEIGADRLAAASKGFGWLEAGGAESDFAAAARHHLALRGNGTHDYKLTEAIFDYAAQIRDPAWRRRLLAAGMVYYRGPSDRIPAVIEEVRAALA